VSAMVKLIWFKCTEFNGLPQGPKSNRLSICLVFHELVEHSGFQKGTKTAGTREVTLKWEWKFLKA